jgi:uncharacterized protein
MSLNTSSSLRLVVFQPTSFCNLNCDYCYVPGRRESARMSEAVIRAAASFIFALAPADQRSFQFLWHAGEPLVVGVPYYRRAFALIEAVTPPDALVTHTIQTNGTLITQSWCQFFREYGVRVGVSIDGPAALHNAHRRSWSGTGTHARVLEGCRLLREHEILPRALCVLTRESLSYPDEIYDFFANSGFTSVGFNVEEVEGANLASSLGSGAASEVARIYRTFMLRMWHRWRDDDCRLQIREFAQELSCVLDLQANPRFVREPDEVIPFAIVTVRKDGALGTFAPELLSTLSRDYDDFIIGNVLSDTPAEVKAGEAFRRLARDVSRGRTACSQTCTYYPLCGGGFQSNRMAEHGSLVATETTTCRVHRKALADVVLQELLAESERLRRVAVR